MKTLDWPQVPLPASFLLSLTPTSPHFLALVPGPKIDLWGTKNSSFSFLPIPCHREFLDPRLESYKFKGGGYTKGWGSLEI